MKSLHLFGVAGLVLSAATCAIAQPSAERFERSMQQIRQETLIRANDSIPVDQRVTLDYGGYVSFGYLSLDDNNNQNHGLRQTEVVGFARANFDGAHEFFLRYRTGYRDFNQGDSFTGRGSEPIDGDLDAAYYKFDLARFDEAYKGKSLPNNNDLVIKGGRDLVYWGNGLTLSEVIDGGMVDATLGDLTLSFIAGVTPTRTVDFDASRPGFDFNTKRGFYGGMATLKVGQQKPFVYGLVQRDYNKDDISEAAGITTKFDYNSWYIGVGSSGPISDRLLYGLEAVYEGGRSISNSFTTEGGTLPTQIDQTHDVIEAWAGDFRLDYLLADLHRTRLGAEVILASGDNDRTNTTTTFAGNKPGTKDNAFNGFGLLNTGLAFAPTVSNMLAFRIGGSTFPLDFSPSARRVQFGTDIFLFNKLDRDAAIDEVSTTGRFLGWEPDVYMNWQITSDVTFAARYGIFFPDSSTLVTDQARQFLFVNVTYSF
ncbi:MAG TPA: hypothetical protein VHS31_12240 [Tepidisphaeraceae bacterium]|jgi:hypothetical protein|nr:hypothetical protein [Tepidisphaeraceae bacterium]